RLPSGVPGLDSIIGGGLVRGASYLAMGRPGAGKTTFGNQLCFTHVRRGERAVYVTLLAESHASMVRNLRHFSFFDPAFLNRELTYVGAYKTLRDEGLQGLLGLVRQVIQDEKATLLVLDGLAPARDMAGSNVALREFLIELQSLGLMTNCTPLLLANMSAGEANGPVLTIMDSLFELAVEQLQGRTLRTFEVVKFRGSAHLLGRQELVLNSGGLCVYPRTEELLSSQTHPPEASTRRLSTGISTLDELLGGGILNGTTSVILGFTGSGKTTLAMHFLDAGAAIGESSLYFGFYESPPRLLAAADQVGLRLRQYEKAGHFAQIWQGSHEHCLDALAARLLETVRSRRVKRLVIDGLEGLRAAAVEPYRMMRYLTALTNELRALDVTTLITDETTKARGPEIELKVEGTSALAENLILLEYLTLGTELRRMLSVVKQRTSAHNTQLREFRLTPHGMSIAEDVDGAEEIMSTGGEALEGRRNRKPGLGAR
ncbi:MAG TPA: ATPase domain-containing protein, partial [Polyangiaceae bacterium]|nr:ATPase domain-containing protein [Polyangiaceae bacterium]